MKRSVAIGQVFGRLTVTARVRGPGDRVYQECVCACGATSRHLAGNLLRGATRSCGCLERESKRLNSRTHGHGGHGRRSRVYCIWIGMLRRCLNPNATDYKDYGGRGITVCDAWRSFEMFLADVGEPPSERHTIDRIDGALGYYPGNVRWATRREQRLNSRTIRFATHAGKTACLLDWARVSGVKYTTLRARLARGWPLELALNP